MEPGFRTLDDFNAEARHVHVGWNRRRGVYEVITTDGDSRVLFESSLARRCLHVGRGFENDLRDQREARP